MYICPPSIHNTHYLAFVHHCDLFFFFFFFFLLFTFLEKNFVPPHFSAPSYATVLAFVYQRNLAQICGGFKRLTFIWLVPFNRPLQQFVLGPIYRQIFE